MGELCRIRATPRRAFAGRTTELSKKGVAISTIAGPSSRIFVGRLPMSLRLHLPLTQSKTPSGGKLLRFGWSVTFSPPLPKPDALPALRDRAIASTATHGTRGPTIL